MKEKSLSVLVVFLFLCGEVAKCETRVFTNNAGQTIKAEVLSVSAENSTVKIRRSEDGKEFDLPISTLSLDDQNHLKMEWLQKKPTESATTGWRELVIHMPTVNDTAIVSGFHLLDNSTGAYTRRLFAPPNSWISAKISYFPYGDRFVDALFLLPYDGKASVWKLSHRDGILYLSEDNGPEKVCGVQLPKENQEQIFQKVAESEYPEILAISVKSADAHFEALRSFPHACSVASPSSIDEKKIKLLSRTNLIGLRAWISPPDLEHLEKLPKTLIALDLTNSLGGRRPGHANEGEFPPIPNLRHLATHAVTPTKWEAVFEQMPELRTLSLFQSARKGYQPSDPIVEISGISNLGKLEGLSLSGRLQISPAEIGASRNLRAFRHAISRLPKEPDLSPIGKLSKLVELRLPTGALSQNSLNKWFASGNLSELQVFESSLIPEISAPIPNLKELHITEAGDAPFPVESIASVAATLKSLSLTGIDEQELKSLLIEGLDPTSIEALKLVESDLTETLTLASFSNLKFLNLDKNQGGFQELNLSLFPKLEMLRIDDDPVLESISKVAAHSSLANMVCSGCPNLSSLGEPSQNQVLRRNYFVNCPKITSLKFLKDASKFQDLMIYKCNGLEEPIYVDEFESIRHIYIQGSEKLESRALSSFQGL